MQNSEYTIDSLLDQTVTTARNSVKTQYACQVIAVSDDGRFVDVAHNTLEWRATPDGNTVMRNSYNRYVVCSPVKPWIVRDVPVEETYERGQWKVRARPRVGDRGILSVFYHDIKSLKDKGGFQAPDAIRVMAIDSASWRPGLPNHADVNADPTYPSDDEWELNGNGVKIKLTSPADNDSQSPNKMDVTVGTVQFTIEVPKNGTPTINFNAPDGTINVNTQVANITATSSVTIDTPATTITGTLSVNGATTLGATLDVTDAITGSSTIEGKGIKDTTTNVTLGTHTHGVPPSTPTPTPNS